ncbi:MAG: radical SAM protein [Deltaproteobacteria bacterium]|nr:radical SAM protein [Deltaproteobacteria bacterium]
MESTKPIRKIALISPNPRFPDFEGRLVMAENTLPLIGTVLKNAGYEVEVFMERIAPIPWERVLEADLVGFSAITCTVNRVYEMVKKIKAHKDVPTVLGGPHASMIPDDAVRYVDYVVRDEGEETIIELLEALNHGGDIRGIQGISYLKGGKPHHNSPRELVKNLDTIPDLSLVHGYDRLNPIQLLFKGIGHFHFLETSRGCPYPCKFCWRIGGKTMRHRSPEVVIEDLKRKTRFFPGFPNWVFIIDSYFGVNRQKSKEVLRQIIQSGVKARSFVFARYEIAEDLEMLDLMRKAGVMWIFMGIESISDNTLTHFDKKQTIEKVKKSLKIIRSYGIHVCASFILGNDEDSSDTWLKTVQFAKDNEVTWVMLNILTNFPSGHEELIPSHRVFQKNWDYYSGQFVLHYPKNIKPSELQSRVYDAYRYFYSSRAILTNLAKGKITTAFFQTYCRFRIRPFLEKMKFYIPYLKQIEDGLYDASGCLIESKLISLKKREAVPSFNRQPMESDLEVVSQVA